MNNEAATIWIDLDNTPHVPFFGPIIRALREKGYRVMVTARDAFQVVPLARLHGIEVDVIGKHPGKNSVRKVLGLAVRAVQLLPVARKARPILAVSHGSRAQALAARCLGISTVVMADYEHVTFLTRPDWIFMPMAVPVEVAEGMGRKAFLYPGIKEDVYACEFIPQPDLLERLGGSPDEILVTVRPPATEAHYHSKDSDVLFDEVMCRLSESDGVRIIMLPRNARQEIQIASRWRDLLESGKMVIPQMALDGLNLIWHSDLVISGGGTMNREAAALGVPVYSIFRGSIGSVDRYLQDSSRLTLVTSVDDARNNIRLVKRKRSGDSHVPSRVTLNAIVDAIDEAALMAEGQRVHR